VQELNLENNLLTDVSGLSSLRRLVSLKLAGNKVGFEGAFNAARAADRLPSPLNGAASDLTVPSSGDMFPSLQVRSHSCASIESTTMTHAHPMNEHTRYISQR
jgi:hypothetical protein